MYIIGLGFCVLPNIKCTFSSLLWFMFIALATLFYALRVLFECVVESERCYIPFLVSLVLFSSPIFIKLYFNSLHYFVSIGFPSVA